MTRFLQHVFGMETRFFVTMRHPFGATYHFYHRFNDEKKTRYYNDCGERDVRSFLKIYGTLLEDIPYLKHVGVVSLESLLDSRNTRAIAHAAEHLLGLAPSIQISPINIAAQGALHLAEIRKPPVEFLTPKHPRSSVSRSPLLQQWDYKSKDPTNRNTQQNVSLKGSNIFFDEPEQQRSVDPTESKRGFSLSYSKWNQSSFNREDISSEVQTKGGSRYPSENIIGKHATRRRLLHFRGDRNALEVLSGPGAQFGWVETFKKLQPNFSERCKHVIEKYEAKLNGFGYSLRKFTQHSLPSFFHDYLLLPEAYTL